MKWWVQNTTAEDLKNVRIVPFTNLWKYTMNVVWRNRG